MTVGKRLRDAQTESVKAGGLNFGHIGYWLSVDNPGFVVRAQIVSISHNLSGDVKGHTGLGSVLIVVRLPDSQQLHFEFDREDPVQLVLPDTLDTSV
ncbi:hypothetical protein [Nocardia fluminea]|uniref:hypothetical protein n=1 Tax=Nocardia fluminea TaxID=134984 RepID=UPI0036668250